MAGFPRLRFGLISASEQSWSRLLAGPLAADLARTLVYGCGIFEAVKR